MVTKINEREHGLIANCTHKDVRFKSATHQEAVGPPAQAVLYLQRFIVIKIMYHRLERLTEGTILLTRSDLVTALTG